MMSDFEILKDLIRDEALITVEDEYGKKTLILEETDNQPGEEYILKIRDLPSDFIAFKADLFPPPKRIFKNTKSECKRADFVVIASDQNQNWIVYIEMKYGKVKSNNDVRDQLRGSQCLVSYCRAIGKEFWKKRDFLKKENYQQCFISVKNVGMPKRQTQPKIDPSRNDTPERMRTIDSPPKGRVPFFKLV